MEIKELRIGNYYKTGIEFTGSIAAKIHLIENQIFQLNSEALQNILMFGLSSLIEPVPITDNLADIIDEALSKYDILEVALLKIDVANENNYSCDKKEPDFRYYFVINNNLGDMMSYGVRIEIKYIHKIQNLYFALTGKEIENIFIDFK